MIKASDYTQQKAFQYARSLIDVFGPQYGSIHLYSKDGHKWSDHCDWLFKPKIFYAVCVHWRIRDGTLDVWSNMDTVMIGIEEPKK